MAFVYKEERKAFIQKPSSALGPGQYIAQTQLKKIKENVNAPFETQSRKLKSAMNFNPGPGTYYHDESKERLDKVIFKADMKNISQAEQLLQVKNIGSLDSDEPCNTKIIVNSNRERLGFEVKEKRFKDIPDSGPGPASYFPSRPLSAKIPIIKNNLVKMNNILDGEVAPPSIPYKNENGFDIGPDDELIRIPDSNQYKNFDGRGESTVGPGSYQLDYPESWHKPGPCWSKMTSDRLGSAKTGGLESKASTRPGTAFDLKVARKSVKSKHYAVSRVLTAQRNKRKENMKKVKEDMADSGLGKVKETGGAKYYEEFLDFTNKHGPGPGYYIDMEKESDFHSTPYPESHQFFGSNSERFLPSNTNAELGPTTYFSETPITTPTQRLAPFSTTSKRFGSSKAEKISKNMPAPGSYNPKLNSQIGKNHFSNKVTIFNLRQKRFDERNSNLKWQMDTPGPGAYINPYTATGTSNTVMVNGLYIDLRKGKDLTRPKSTKPRILKHNIDATPDPTTYDPQKIFTIAYNVKKKANQKKGKDIAFNTHKEKKKKPEFKTNVGPGFYYKEKMLARGQVYPPFHQSDTRFQDIDGLGIGPGQYDSRSYFDWNKKTYNISFI